MSRGSARLLGFLILTLFPALIVPIQILFFVMIAVLAIVGLFSTWRFWVILIPLLASVVVIRVAVQLWPLAIPLLLFAAYKLLMSIRKQGGLRQELKTLRRVGNRFEF